MPFAKRLAATLGFTATGAGAALIVYHQPHLSDAVHQRMTPIYERLIRRGGGFSRLLRLCVWAGIEYAPSPLAGGFALVVLTAVLVGAGAATFAALRLGLVPALAPP